jgi:phosphohistidine swiveling domain-containing protein
VYIQKISELHRCGAVVVPERVTNVSSVQPLSAFGREDIELAGGKGANLGELVRAGLPVPPGFVVTTDAYRQFVGANDLTEQILDPRRSAGDVRDLITSGVVPDELREQVLAAYADLGRPPVAVRSSATAEDLADASFAGQQDTYLNVRGEEALIDAVRRCWASLWTERAVAYRLRQGIDPGTVALAVVVQEMVDADAAGVLFTANPTNGRRQEAVIGAAWGLGEAVVSGAVNTDDLVVAKTDGHVISRTTADKAVMTGYTDDGTAERDVPADRRTQPVLDDAAAAELVRIGSMIEAHFGAPQDIEWTRAGGKFHIVQSRPVTALPLPEADPPSDWSVPDRSSMYVRGSIVEQLPDPLTPLFADLIDSSVTRSLQALFRELLGDTVVREGDVNLPTVNGYAYYRYGLVGGLRLTLRSGKAFRMLLTPGHGGTEDRWRTYAHPRYLETVRTESQRAVEDRSSAELVAGVRTLLDAGTEYYTAVQTIIPLAASSELLFTGFYERLVRRPGDPAASTFLVGFDSLPIRAEKSLYELAGWVRERPRLADLLRSTPTAELVAALDEPTDEPTDEPAREADPDLAGWRERFRAHLETYGHTIYNLDFANAVPADDPAPLVETLRFYLAGSGADPYARQQGLVERREQATRQVLDRLDPVRARAFRRLLRWAQRSAPLREDALGDIGLAWPLMRRMLLELGRRLLDSPDDVFWVRERELAALVDGGRLAGLDTELERRREIWRGRRRVTPPQILPEHGVMEKLFFNMLPATMADQTGQVLTGIGASAGRVSAPARVLSGPDEFATMQPGDVLVTSITTPAWTSLFAMASAVVTDIGGPLSHSSIVAREYGIPAVLGTAVATRRIHTGETIVVDGDAGTVTLPGASEASAESSPESSSATADPTRAGHRRTAVLVGGAVVAVLVAVRRRRSRARAKHSVIPSPPGPGPREDADDL